MCNAICQGSSYVGQRTRSICIFILHSHKNSRVQNKQISCIHKASFEILILCWEYFFDFKVLEILYFNVINNFIKFSYINVFILNFTTKT